MFHLETDIQKAAGAREIIEPKYPWIGQVLRTNLQPLDNQRAMVLCVGPGSSEELFFIRDFVGPKATIYAFDIRDKVDANGITNFNAIAIVANDVCFWKGDARNIKAELRKLPRTPDLVVSRHPQIIEQVEMQPSGEALATVVNDWWPESLTEIAQRVHRSKGQMLMTFYVPQEREMVETVARRRNLPVILNVNNFCPLGDEHSPDGKVLYFRTQDRYTMVVR